VVFDQIMILFGVSTPCSG